MSHDKFIYTDAHWCPSKKNDSGIWIAGSVANTTKLLRNLYVDRYYFSSVDEIYGSKSLFQYSQFGRFEMCLWNHHFPNSFKHTHIHKYIEYIHILYEHRIYIYIITFYSRWFLHNFHFGWLDLTCLSRIQALTASCSKVLQEQSIQSGQPKRCTAWQHKNGIRMRWEELW